MMQLSPNVQKPKQKLLIVEDDLAIREGLQELLESEGFPVILAENGQQALEILSAQSAPPCMILLDLFMPVMDGKTFLERFADQLPQFSKIPILIMSAAGPGHVPSHPSSLFLRKPLDVDRLMATISKHISVSERIH